MSDPDVDDPISLLNQSNVNFYISVVSLTILWYDYIITLDLEISRFWRYGRQLTWASALFYVNRYVGVLGHIPIALEYYWTGYQTGKSATCDKLQKYHQYLSIAIQIITGIMLLLRTYALYDRSKRILTILLTTTISALIVGCYLVVSGSPTKPAKHPEAYIGCSASITKAYAIRFGATWFVLLGFDILVFGLTLYKAIRLRRRTSKGVMGAVALLSLMLRDGTLYFGILAGANFANIMTFFFGATRIRGVATTLMNVMSTTMISRLMLNLRDPSISLVSRTESGNTLTSTGAIWTTQVLSTSFGASFATRTTEAYSSEDEMPSAWPIPSKDPGWETFSEFHTRRGIMNSDDVELVTVPERTFDRSIVL